jgi:hypothetical protein
MRTRAEFRVRAVFVGMLLTCLGASVGSGARVGSAGVGIRITRQDGHIRIVDVLDGPARRGGLQAGDEIVAIDGQPQAGKELSDVVQAIVGPPGTAVRLTIARAEEARRRRFDVVLTRGDAAPGGQPARPGASGSFVPTKAAGPVEWDGNRIISRVLPYPDVTSLSIRLPIAHAAVTGKGVKAAVLCRADGRDIEMQIRRAAPDAEVKTYALPVDGNEVGRCAATLQKDGCRIAVIPDAPAWPAETLTALADLLIARDIVVVVPSDLSESNQAMETVHRLHSCGALTVGRVARDSTVLAERRDTVRPFNRHIRRIDTDLFCTVGLPADPNHANIAGTAAGVAALVREKWPDMPGVKVREKMIAAGRAAWQATDIETGAWPQDLFIDPVTTEYRPGDQVPVFRFRVLDAAASVDVDTKIPWFLNMLNCQKAWEITRGKGVIVALSDQGFHLKHPELVGRIEKTQHFGPVTFDRPNQHFHGTEMSRILLRVAPEARIIPLLCSAPNFDDLAVEIAKSLQYAVQEQVDVISASWMGRYGADPAIQSAIEEAVSRGIVVSWFHFPRHVPGVLRPRLTYAAWEPGPNLGLADRFLADPPGFHPVEIESGLSGTAPQAAGIAALVRSVNSRLTPAQIEELIFKNSTPIGNNIVIPDAYQIVLAAQQTGNSRE